VPRTSTRLHTEGHAKTRGGRLRAGVLGANDGLLSTAGLLIGVAAADVSRSVLLTTGLAGLFAGAFSMAVGEYSSVSSQRDAERADLAKEKDELATSPRSEQAELTSIYLRRGLSFDLANQVATQLMAHDALEAHARDELGLDPNDLARPVEAAVVSALSFMIGALLAVVTVVLVPGTLRVPGAIVVTLAGLGVLGAIGAHLGGAPKGRAAARVLIGGAVALALSAAIGQVVGAAV
jgi:VIT1/CCC1 family predicted Fe2+/Mn2+ transporter